MTNFDRTIFTKRSRWDIALDYILAVALGLSLTMLALAYFDVL